MPIPIISKVWLAPHSIQQGLVLSKCVALIRIACHVDNIQVIDPINLLIYHWVHIDQAQAHILGATYAVVVPRSLCFRIAPFIPIVRLGEGGTHGALPISRQLL